MFSNAQVRDQVVHRKLFDECESISNHGSNEIGSPNELLSSRESVLHNDEPLTFETHEDATGFLSALYQ